MKIQLCNLHYLRKLIDTGSICNYGMLLLFNGTYQFSLFTDQCIYKSYPMTYDVLMEIRRYAILHGLEFLPQLCDDNGLAL